jgi:uncharacterized protein involved in outer membrane biogenesis
MKKTAGIIIKIFLGIILLVLVILFTVPIIFKKQIKSKVEQAINSSVNATVKFENYKLGFFRDFPNLSFRLENLSVTGIGKFEGDTLASFRSFDLVFNLMSLLSKSGYEVKSIKIDKANVNAIVLKNGSANWELSKPSVSNAPITSLTPAMTSTPVSSSTSGSSMKILLRNLEIKNSSITYSDSSLLMDARIEDLNFKLKGSMTFKETIVKMTLTSGATTVIIGGVKYLNKVKIDSKINMLAELDSMKFTLRDNYFSINELKISLSGAISMPGKDIKTDLHFGTDKASFKRSCHLFLQYI